MGPRCDLCTLGTQKICPSAQTVVKSRSKKAITTVKEESGPKIEIAIEETSTVILPKGEPASPCLSASSSLTTVPDDA
jgi:endonuclease-3